MYIFDCFFFFFFFQAEDGIRDLTVTGVQTCALPILIVSDIAMPRMNGLELCQRVRQASTTPVILLTAANSEEQIIKGFELGADDYVTDRKSTRLNSSHSQISYAVFCLKKKRIKTSDY